MNKIWVVKVSCPGWFDMEFPFWKIQKSPLLVRVGPAFEQTEFSNIDRWEKFSEINQSKFFQKGPKGSEF